MEPPYQVLKREFADLKRTLPHRRGYTKRDHRVFMAGMISTYYCLRRIDFEQYKEFLGEFCDIDPIPPPAPVPPPV